MRYEGKFSVLNFVPEEKTLCSPLSVSSVYPVHGKLCHFQDSSVMCHLMPRRYLPEWRKEEERKFFHCGSLVLNHAIICNWVCHRAVKSVIRHFIVTSGKCNSPFHNTSAPARLRWSVPHVSTKPLKSSQNLHAEILFLHLKRAN